MPLASRALLLRTAHVLSVDCRMRGMCRYLHSVRQAKFEATPSRMRLPAAMRFYSMPLNQECVAADFRSLLHTGYYSQVPSGKACSSATLRACIEAVYRDGLTESTSTQVSAVSGYGGYGLNAYGVKPCSAFRHDYRHGNPACQLFPPSCSSSGWTKSLETQVDAALL